MKTSYKLPAAGMIALLIAASAAFVGAGVTFAQTTTYMSNGTSYIVPEGFTALSDGVFYDSATSMYYDPITGQYSSTAPTGPAAMTALGTYSIPAGYIPYNYGAYYDPATDSYYDPSLGFYSSTAPVGPITESGSVAAATGTTNPGLPNTGAGGNAPETIVLLGLLGILTIAGIVLMIQNTPIVS